MIAGRIILMASLIFACGEVLSRVGAAGAEDAATTSASATPPQTTQTNCPPCPPAGPCTVLPPTTDCGPPAQCVVPCEPCVLPAEPCIVEPSDAWIQPCPPLEAFPMQGMPVQGMPMQGMPMQGMPMQGMPMQGMPMQVVPMQVVPMQVVPMQVVPMQVVPMQGVPMMPLPMSASPRPAPLGPPMFTAPPIAVPPPGGIFVPPGTVPLGTVPAAAEGPLANIAPGGAISPQFGLPRGPEPLPGIANPILVPVTDDQLAWDQIVDVVSGYFHVSREQQARRSGEAWSEGRIETLAQSGATLFEPQRDDSVGWFNIWESTFQSIRRTAVVRVIPDPNGYLVEVVVQKELEDLPQPEKSTVGAATLRHDGSLPSHRIADAGRTRKSARWISQGRDPALEQRMLADIHARLTGVTTDGSIFR